MKKAIYLTVAAAFLLAACAETGIDEVRTVTLCAVLGDDASTGSKAVIGTAGSGKPQTFWEDGDQITVYTQADGDSGSQRGYEFSATLGTPAASAEFSYTGEGCQPGNLLAIYPAATAARTVNFTGTGDIYKMAAVDVPVSQTLVAGSFDRNAAVSTAYAPQGSDELVFRNAVALIKFRVSESGIKQGRIVVDGNDAIAGCFRADLGTAAPYLPVLTDYNQTVYNYVNFEAGGDASLSTGTDYYVAVRPTTLTSSLEVYLNGCLVKSVTSSQLAELARNKVYNLGTLSTAGAQQKELFFDFSGTPLSGWPTDQNKAEYPHVEGGAEYSYPLYGTSYSLLLADCGGATNATAQVFWHTSTNAVVFNAAKRYLGFPVISGYKLTKVVCHNKSGVTTAKFEIVNRIMPNSSDNPSGSDIVSAAQTWATKDIDYTYELTGTDSSTRYYLYCMSKGSVGSLTLTYIAE